MSQGVDSDGDGDEYGVPSHAFVPGDLTPLCIQIVGRRVSDGHHVRCLQPREAHAEILSSKASQSDA